MERSLGIQLDSGSLTPIYQQIADQIDARVRAGTLPANFRLPPTRSLASALSTHRNTIVRAYDELSERGLVESHVGRGTYIRTPNVLPDVGFDTAPLPWSSLLSRTVDTDALNRGSRLVPSRPSDAVDLMQFQPPPELRPSDQLRKCLDYVLRTKGASALGYAPRGGVPELREIIATELSKSGVPATADDVMITTGGQQALDLIARTLIDPGAPFLVDESTYSGAINVLSAAGARLIGVTTDREGPDPGALRHLTRAGAKGFYLMPNCGNPTGKSISEARRHELVRWSRDAGVPLIEDDYGADLILDDERQPTSLRALDGEVIYLGTFSKKLLPALRVGFLVCPKALQRHVIPLKQAADLGTSVLLQHALVEFIDRGYLRQHLATCRPIYRARRSALVAALRRTLPASVQFDVPKAGLLLWLNLPNHIDPEVAARAAQDAGVLVTPSTLNSVTGAGGGGLRLTFCAESEDRLRLGAERLGAALTTLDTYSSRDASRRVNLV